MNWFCRMKICHSGCFLFEGKDGNYVREKHWHRSIEMFVVLEGKLDFYINEEDIHLDEKSFVIVNSNELHSISAPFPNKTIVLQMPLQTFERYYTDEQFICFTHSERVQDEQLVELVEKMYVTYQKKKTGYELKVQSYFYMLVYLMVTKYRKVDVSAEIVRDHKNRNRLLRSRIISRIIIRKISRWKGWHRSSGIRRPICHGCFANMQKSTIKNIFRESVWNMPTGN